MTTIDEALEEAIANFAAKRPKTAALHERAKGVPYGIALAGGALLAWPSILTMPV